MKKPKKQNKIKHVRWRTIWPSYLPSIQLSDINENKLTNQHRFWTNLSFCIINIRINNKNDDDDDNSSWDTQLHTINV